MPPTSWAKSLRVCPALKATVEVTSKTYGCMVQQTLGCWQWEYPPILTGTIAAPVLPPKEPTNALRGCGPVETSPANVGTVWFNYLNPLFGAVAQFGLMMSAAPRSEVWTQAAEPPATFAQIQLAPYRLPCCLFPRSSRVVTLAGVKDYAPNKVPDGPWFLMVSTVLAHSAGRSSSAPRPGIASRLAPSSSPATLQGQDRSSS